MRTKGFYPAIREVILLGKHVLAAQGGRCWICNKSMKAQPKHRAEWLANKNDPLVRTQDHIIPRSVLNGIGLHNNKLWAHRGCNNERGNCLPTSEQAAKVRMILIGALARQLAD